MGIVGVGGPIITYRNDAVDICEGPCGAKFAGYNSFHHDD